MMTPKARFVRVGAVHGRLGRTAANQSQNGEDVPAEKQRRNPPQHVGDSLDGNRAEESLRRLLHSMGYRYRKLTRRELLVNPT
jgi:hypothetical protein